MSSDTKPTIYLLSPFVSHYDPLLKGLMEIEHIEIRIINFAALDNDIQMGAKYVLLVDARFNQQTLLRLQTHPILQQSQASALIFAPKQPNLMLLAIWDNLAGYFYHTTSSHEFCQQMMQILDGKNCLPKSLLIDLFKHWQTLNRQKDHSMLKTRLSLTKRELEILSHLKMNHSNLDIADLLFVSEHTIKSHLYRIFKKLNVSNRRQAINWAQLYLQ